MLSYSEGLVGVSGIDAFMDPDTCIKTVEAAEPLTQVLQGTH